MGQTAGNTAQLLSTPLAQQQQQQQQRTMRQRPPPTHNSVVRCHAHADAKQLGGASGNNIQLLPPEAQSLAFPSQVSASTLTRKSLGHYWWVTLHSLSFSETMDPAVFVSCLEALFQQYPCEMCRNNILALYHGPLRRVQRPLQPRPAATATTAVIIHTPGTVRLVRTWQHAFQDAMCKKKLQLLLRDLHDRVTADIELCQGQQQHQQRPPRPVLSYSKLRTMYTLH